MSDFELYKLFILYPNINGMTIIFSLSCFFIFLFTVMFYFFDDNSNHLEALESYEKKKEYRKLSYWLFFIFIFSLFVHAIFPSNDQVNKFISVKYLSNNNDIKEIPGITSEYIKSLTELNKKWSSGDNG